MTANKKSKAARRLRAVAAGMSYQAQVNADGFVHLDPIPSRSSPGRFAEDLGARLRFREETYGAGNGYVGADTAADTDYATRLLDGLVFAWNDRR